MGGKLKFLLFIFLLFVAFSCRKDIAVDDVQSESYVKLFGGSPLDIARDIVVTDEYTAITGAMNTASKGLQAFVIFTDKFGNELDSVLIGDGLNDTGNCIFKTTDGNLIMVGTKSVTSLNTDLLVAKITVSGSVLWSYTFGGAGKEEGSFGLELSSGGYVVGGYTESLGNEPQKDIYLLKLDADGHEIGVNPSIIGAQNDETGNDITELNGFIYIIGSTESFQVPRKEIYVVRINLSDNTKLDKIIPANIVYDGIKICKLPDNKLLLMGSDAANNSTYLNCINSDFTVTYWEKEFISTKGEHYNDLFFNNNQLFLCGVTQIHQNTDIYIHRLDQAAGNEVGTTIIPSAGDQNLISGSIGSDGKLSITGSTTINGFSQIFLIKTGI
jgi:hypothetical protein